MTPKERYKISKEIIDYITPYVDLKLKEQAGDMLMSFHSIICIPYIDEREKALEELKQKHTSNSANKKVRK